LSVKAEEDEVEYTLRAIPAGGFVSFPQHYEVSEEGARPGGDK
jgi:membrane-associated protease RseP (regulator of RpoE activity)